MTLKFYIKKEEDSLYFEHFFKVVYNKARKIGGLWIKLRKLKYFEKLTKRENRVIIKKKFISKGEQNMNFHLTDQRKKKINSVQSIPMKHCAEYSV